MAGAGMDTAGEDMAGAVDTATVVDGPGEDMAMVADIEAAMDTVAVIM